MVTFSPVLHTRSMFTEGAAAPGCFQKLKNLVATVLKAVLQFFKTIFSCFQKKTPTPIDPRRVDVQPTHGQSLNRLIHTDQLPQLQANGAVPGEVRLQPNRVVHQEQRDLRAPLPGLVGAGGAGQAIHEEPAAAGIGGLGADVDHPDEIDGDELIGGQDDEDELAEVVAVDGDLHRAAELDDPAPGLVFNLPGNGAGIVKPEESDLDVKEEFDPRTMIKKPLAEIADSSSESDSVDDGHLSDPELDARFPNPGPRRAKRDQIQVRAQGFRPPTSGDKVWEGTFKFSDFPEVGKGGRIFAVLKGIELLWPKIARKEVILGELLDQIVGEGCLSFSAAGHEKDAFAAHTDALKSFESLEEVQVSLLEELTSPRYPTNQFGTTEDLRKPQKPIGNSYPRRVEQMAGSLQITAKELRKNLIAGIILKGSPQAPEPFGVFAYFNDARAKWDFFFLDCGAEGKPISLHRFPGMGTFRNYVAFRAPAKLEDDEHNMFQLIPIALRN